MSTTSDQRWISLLQEENNQLRGLFEGLARDIPAIAAQLHDLDEQRVRLRRRDRDPEVLVRTGPGPAVEIYHSAQEPCRRVHPEAVKQGKYERLLLREASEDRELRPCTACAAHLKPRRRKLRRISTSP